MIGYILVAAAGVLAGVGLTLMVTENWRRGRNWRGKDTGYQK